MDRDQVVQVVRERVAELFEVAPEGVGESTSFQEDLQLDSLAVVELLVVAEEALGVDLMEVPPADVPTVGALADVVLGKAAN